MKSTVEFVRKKLDNAIEIMCTLGLSTDSIKLDKWNSAFVTSCQSQTEKKKQSNTGGLNSTRADLKDDGRFTVNF